MPRGSSPKRERQYEHIKEGLEDISSSRRGGLHSHSGAQGPTYEQLYAEARRRNIHGRSDMNKTQLKRALGE
ncbi:hypothetical protein GT352_29235 [Streptomyces sp. SID1046]|uniref:hypothetical protein n=1 Tax=Streptomyces sp. SID1046 TaxID=2690249 RepID=UPI001369A2B7|nr:hypothetical protein [Streptomyces sp. SID1046]MYV77985.1 hypothetical protein [Streptomyces sp. SID1046]